MLRVGEAPAEKRPNTDQLGTQLPLEQSLETQLKGIVGDDWVISDPGRLLAYESDGLTAYRMPQGHR